MLMIMRAVAWVGLGCVLVATAGCSNLEPLEEALSPGADETYRVTSEDNPEVPAGVVVFGATWFEDTDVISSDVRDDVVAELESDGASLSCEETTQRLATPFSPAWLCTFTLADAREGTFTIHGGGPVTDEFPEDTDGVAINLEAEYPQR